MEIAPTDSIRPKETKRCRRILILGARGVANYGGFESFVAGLAPRLVSKGFAVRCSSEKGGAEPATYKGVRLDYFPLPPPLNPKIRVLFEPLYDLYFILRGGYDIVFGLGCLGGLAYFWPRLIGKKSVVNVAGLEWRRGRYGLAEKMAIKSLWVGCTISATRIALDNRQLSRYVNPRLRSKIAYAPYAIEDDDPARSSWDETPIRWTLGKGSYWMHMARIEPDNKVLDSILALSLSRSKKKLLVVGNFTVKYYEEKILSEVSRLGLKDRVSFMKPIYGKTPVLNEIRAESFGYIHGHSVGGTAPSLLEIMRLGKATLAFDTPFNRDVGGEALLYHDSSEALARNMDYLEDHPDEARLMGHRAKAKVSGEYGWKTVTELYTRLFG